MEVRATIHLQSCLCKQLKLPKTSVYQNAQIQNEPKKTALAK